MKTAGTPRVVDNDRDEITVTLAEKEIRGWSYESEAERRTKILAAREFVEGWYQAKTEAPAARGVTEAHLASLENHIKRAEDQFGECSYINWLKFDLSTMRAALQQPVENAPATQKVCRYCGDGLGSYNCFCTGSSAPATGGEG
jgi:hypothetical protein